MTTKDNYTHYLEKREEIRKEPFGGFFRNMFGTKLYLGEPDARMFRERPYISAIQDTHNYMDEPFVPDVEIHDDEIIQFGNLPIHFYLVPGDSLSKVRDQKVDVFLGNHCVNTDTLKRRQSQLQDSSHNPFVDPAAWGRYLDNRRDALLDFTQKSN